MGLSILSEMPLPCFVRLPSQRFTRAQDAVLTAGALRLWPISSEEIFYLIPGKKIL
jgi:hypothetical protein